jgi:hypothetical protein
MKHRCIYIVLLIIFLFSFLLFINTKEGLQSLGCYRIDDVSGITMEHALHAKGILYNPDLDATFKTRLLKAMRVTDTEDPFFYNLLYDSDKLPGPKIREVTDMIDSYFVPCT